jgi:hypothetical protein
MRRAPPHGKRFPTGPEWGRRREFAEAAEAPHPRLTRSAASFQGPRSITRRHSGACRVFCSTARDSGGK